MKKRIVIRVKVGELIPLGPHGIKADQVHEVYTVFNRELGESLIEGTTDVNELNLDLETGVIREKYPDYVLDAKNRLQYYSTTPVRNDNVPVIIVYAS